MTTHNLSNLVLEITMSAPNGLNHAQLVVAVLQTGYQHHESGNLSEDLHRVVRKLVKNGLIEKNPETRTIRKVQCV